jgi:serine phosphatase RsbU (regulator of sigma subunit)
MRQGETSDAAWFLADGALAVFADTAYGSVPLSTVRAPHLIGEIGVLAGLPRTASVKAAGVAKVHRIDRAQLVALGERMPELLVAIIAQLGRQIGTVNGAISLYTQALEALERREFDARIIDDLRSPPPQIAEFAAAFERFARAIVDKRKQEQEMAGAAAIQMSLLPPVTTVDGFRSGVDIAVRMRPARDVGGDFYDLVPLDDRRFAFAVGDVCGKGLPASLFMSVAVTVLRTAALEAPDVATAIARANRLLCRDNAASMFATTVYGVIDAVSGDVAYANCGHNPPIRIAAAGGQTPLPATGLPLAMFADRSATAAHVHLAPGEALLVYSDGITEAMNAAGEEFGEERLAEFLARAAAGDELPAVTMLQSLYTAVDLFAGEAEQADDMTAIFIRKR